MNRRSKLMARLALLFAPLVLTVVSTARELSLAAPSQIYGELFVDVQVARIFPDSKTFVDAVAKAEPGEILARYRAAKGKASFSLREFVAENFVIPAQVEGEFKTRPQDGIKAHVHRLWSVLTREPHPKTEGSSALPLETRFVVPGGRFREMYYWDSYFTMLGLQVDGRHDLVADMVENFAALIDRYGHIPNGTRTYYLSRSQPPFFAHMVELQAEHDGDQALVRRLPQLEREHGFWMDGASGLAPGQAHRRVVRMVDGSLLNRYWDDLAIARDEAYVEDLHTAQSSGRPNEQVFRDLRAAAESGWDFSSRWLTDGKTLATIHTTDIAPVDLNSLLFQLETTIAKGCRLAKRADCQREMSGRAHARRKAIRRWLWDEKAGAFMDFDWRNGRRLEQLTAATLYPLFAGLVERRQARRVAEAVRAFLLMPHGLATTTVVSGEQWDHPNGWAPLQWIAVHGLRQYGEGPLAENIARRWMAENARVYCLTGKLVEKYNVRDAGEGAGGEYPVQDGFGWTNAVLVKLLALYPPAAGTRYEYTGAACRTTGTS